MCYGKILLVGVITFFVVTSYTYTLPNKFTLVESKDNAYYITKRYGGDGAVREICDLIIRSKGSDPSLESERYIKER